MNAPYIHSQPVLKTFFSCMKSCSLSSDRMISVRRTWFVARVRNVMSGNKLERRVREAECRLAVMDLRLGARSDGLSLPRPARNRAVAEELLETRERQRYLRFPNALAG